jgi:HD superfamily phosphohydrolase
MMVFARYVMFSEVYWHHAVRAATAMLQRAAYELRAESNITHSWIDMNEMQMIQSLCEAGQGTAWAACIDGLFGAHRKLYKRVAQFDCLSHPLQHAALARKPYDAIAKLSKEMTSIVAQRIGITLGPHDILIDAPPVKLEVQFQLDVRQSDASFRPLGDLSPVVHALATRQFDDLVKRVRIFVRPEIQALVTHIDFAELVLQVTQS